MADEGHERRLPATAFELSAEIAPFCPDADQSLENADSYPGVLSSVRNPLSRALSRPAPDISREACRIASRDKMSDSSSRKRKRERWIKGQDGVSRRGRTVRRRWEVGVGEKRDERK